MRKRTRRGSAIHRSLTQGYLKQDEHQYGVNWESEIRPRILQRDNYTCCKCFIRLPPPFHKYLHVHHKHAYLKSGSHASHNLETLCIDCHSSEHDRYLGKVPAKVRNLFKR